MSKAAPRLPRGWQEGTVLGLLGVRRSRVCWLREQPPGGRLRWGRSPELGEGGLTEPPPLARPEHPAGRHPGGCFFNLFTVSFDAQFFKFS